MTTQEERRLSYREFATFSHELDSDAGLQRFANFLARKLRISDAQAIEILRFGTMAVIGPEETEDHVLQEFTRVAADLELASSQILSKANVIRDALQRPDAPGRASGSSC